MTVFNQQFTDAQGVTHTEALVAIKSASVRGYSHRDYQRQPDGSYQTPLNTSSVSIAYRAVYWPSQALMEAGNQPYVLVDRDGNDQFTVDITAAPYVGLGDIEAAELHLQQVIIPSLVGVGQ